MSKKTNRISPYFLTALIVILVAMMALTCACDTPSVLDQSETGSAEPFIRLVDREFKNVDITSYFNKDVVQRLPDTVKDGDQISIILSTNEENVLDAYDNSGSSLSLSEYVNTTEAQDLRRSINATNESILADLSKKGISYENGVDYYTLLAGKEIVISAEDFYDVCDIVGDRADVIVSEVYETEAYKNVLVNNTVNVYPTGIFNSSNFAYQGEGTVVAVLDTGLDYYHTAFSTKNFTADRNNLGMIKSDVEAVINETVASTMQAGLTASDVYISEKVPFAFDYADGDSDVYPLYSNHGTHVAGVIAGKDDVITGVAPQAQLAIMKIFSDVDAQARASWIIRALEDCVVIGVDIINMSIGTSCGFSRETDKESISGVYDKIRARGINMVVAASNSFNSTYNSEKNGNLGLTSNPDSATVSSPSTYKGALSIASINGAKTSYILYNDQIIYFVESTNRVAEEKNFVDDILGTTETEKTVEYITIPGVGRTADYTGIDVRGKIALIARGSNTFEEKANVAQKQGALGAIIYNNVSGDIRMNVGDTTIAVCSISQDEGELLASKPNGTITISRSQASGPFMSDFSSWGPSPDLEIKPELTAHGGNILSAVPGQDYDEISGTSMATPNVSGLTALIRQYVKENLSHIATNNVEVAAYVNRLLMSTADIVYNTNGLPYSVRKQGAGLANVVDAASTKAVILTYKNGELMDKSKVELGDDPKKNGIYELNFKVYNFGNTALSYDLSTIVMTEGVSETKTNQGDTTVTEDGYILEGANVSINEVANGSVSGNRVTVGAGQTASVKLTITLTDANKKYLDDSFKNGMYVEGFVTLKGLEGATDIGFPYLAFYGDWTVAPMFDLDYFATNKDELDESIDLLDKTLPDAYASRPVGGVYADYVSFLGTYYFEQKPGSNMISADRKYISLSNSEGSIHKLSYAWMGMLRNAKEVDVVITDDATGEVVFSKTEKDIRKSYGDGGPIYPAQVRIGFSPADYNLPNNSTYTVTLTGRLDYGDGGVNTNLNNTFTFPLMVDFQAPVLQDVEFYTEYDKAEKKNRLFAKLAIYDNHYSMSALVGTISANAETGLALNGFDHYLTPIYSDFNGTSYLTYELTDHVDTIKNAYESIKDVYGKFSTEIAPSPLFTISLYDYALNNATYEVALPNKFLDGYFEEKEIVLSPNQTYDLNPVLFPENEIWTEMLTFRSTNSNVAKVLTGTNKLVALKSGKSKIIATYTNPSTGEIKDVFETDLKVLAENETGFQKFDEPVVHKFEIPGYHTNKAYYLIDSTERKIGQTGDDRSFPNRNNLSLSLYPSESVTLRTDLVAYFDKKTTIEFQSSNPDIVTVDKYGTIIAQSEGFASISVKVLKDGKATYYSKNIAITVKDPYITSGPTLTNYYGLGGAVVIPQNLAITEIGTFAFSNVDYVEKTDDDIINDENPELTKQWFIGDNTITSVVIPEGVETISAYAFANLTALKSVKLPSTLTTISYGAFMGCTSLTTVEGLGNVKFINQNAFAYCNLDKTITFNRTIAIADFAFAYNENLDRVVLSEHTQSVGQYAFVNNTSLASLTIGAEKIKLGQFAFSGCSKLSSVSLNTAVIPTGLFNGCTALESITLGKDVAVIGEYAFNNTNVTSITVASGNPYYYTLTDKPYMLSDNGTTLLFVAPAFAGALDITETTVTTIGTAALSGNKKITSFNAPSVTKVGNYAFAGCENLAVITLGNLTEIGDAAFMRTAITETHAFGGLTKIGEYAYYGTKITSVIIPDNFTIGESAFEECTELASVEIGDNVVIGDNAFRRSWELEQNYEEKKLELDGKGLWIYYYDLLSNLTSLTIGDNVEIGNGAFYGASKLTAITLGNNVYIGDQAFYNTELLDNVDLSGATHIGKEAFSGVALTLFYYDEAQETVTSFVMNADGTVRYHIYTNKLSSLTLNAETIASDAFAYSSDLVSVSLGNTVKYVGDRAFGMNENLTTINLENVISVGTQAFASAKLSTVSLDSIVNVGNFAFTENNSLTSVSLGDNVESIGEGAFSYAKLLTTLDGEENVKYIDDYAFAYTAISEADLSSLVSLGKHAFIKNHETFIDEDNDDTWDDAEEFVDTDGNKIWTNAENYVDANSNGVYDLGENYTDTNGNSKWDDAEEFTDTNANGKWDRAEYFDDANANGIFDGIYTGDFKVKLSSNLVEIGDNPFAFCNVKDQFSTIVKNEFNGKEYEEVSYTYDLSDTIKIIDGSIYRIVPNGYELIAFTSKDSKTVTVVDDTVRIGAMAFAGTDVVNVILPYTVASIGHKAFYKCNDLAIVTMQSYYAPVLEEEFDVNYASNGYNAPMRDEDASKYGWYGLGIVDFYMWNMWDSANGIPVYSNFFYGANFIDHIGRIDNPIILVRPVNGENYDSLVMGQYFNLIINGAAAADDITLEAIKAINAIPENVQLSDKATIQKAREAYDKIASYEQRALVKSYQKLTDAELRIKTLESLAGGGEQGTPDETPTEETINIPAMILAIVFSAVGILSALALFIYLFITGKIRLPNFLLPKEKRVLKPKANQKVVKKMVKKVVRRVVVYNPDAEEMVEAENKEEVQEEVEIPQIDQQITEKEIISEEEEDNE